jgi:transcriptional regulator with XRE-family HTH domain
MPYLAQTCQESAKSAPRAAKLRRMTDDEIGRRVKAALAYGGFKLDAAGGILGFSPRTLDRVYSGERDLTVPEAKKLAAATGVPINYILDGWELYVSLEERLSEVQSELRALQEAQVEATAREMEVQAQLSEVKNAIRRLQPPQRP